MGRERKLPQETPLAGPCQAMDVKVLWVYAPAALRDTQSCELQTENCFFGHFSAVETDRGVLGFGFGVGYLSV